MKKYLFISAMLITLATSAQVSPGGNDNSFQFAPVSAQRVRSSDSVQVFATLVTNNTVSSITWIQTGGTAVKIAPTMSWLTGAVGTSAFWLQGLAPGVYTFKATGVSGAGTSGSVTATVTVLADQNCPVCPAQRTATGLQITINGQAFSIPLTGAKITYSDGSTQ